MKILLIVIDGIGDCPIAALENKTPLEAARTPNLDEMASAGVCGTVLPFRFSWQELPQSDSAHLALLGYNPDRYYMGRGVYEAAGIGMDIKPDDVAWRANFGTVDKNLCVTDRRAGRISQTERLVKAIQGIRIDGVNFLIKKSYGHRAGLILRSKKPLSSSVSNGDPHEIGRNVNKITPSDGSRAALFTADVLNKFLETTHDILAAHPLNKHREKNGQPAANYLLIRGPGKLKKIPSFPKRFKMKSGYIAGGALYKGIGKVLGMKEIIARGATGFPNTNVKNKMLAAEKSFAKYDFIFLHIKAADSLAEDGNYLGKRDFIEKIDKAIGLSRKIKDTLVVVTGDHSTCSSSRSHCLEPVPILIWRDRIKNKKSADGFSERACAKGEIGQVKQTELMKKIMLFRRKRGRFL